jgi:hypothetical protein
MSTRRNPIEGETYSHDQAKMLAADLRRQHHTGVKIVKRARHSRYPYTEGPPSKPGKRSSQDAIYVVTSRGQLKRNPGGRKKMTKAQRLANSARKSRLRRKAKAAQAVLKVMNPAGKYAGAKIQRNKGGSVTIIPVKLPKAARR